MEVKKKVLIIDDDGDMTGLLTMRLEMNGYDVISAEDAGDGLAKAMSDDPDLILLDIKMSGMDGHTLLRVLRKHDKKTSSIPIIILTAYADLQDLFDLEGARDYIVKPFNDKDLLMRITRALK
jgi:DNA-binding response OmpR family regulator